MMRLNYAIIHVADMGRSVAFYRDILGLRLKFQSLGWSEFDAGGAIVALHQGEAGRCRPGMSVPDLDQFHARMVTSGVTCVQEPGELFGARIAQYADPDGLVISVSENQARTTE
jgi:lactoylglutathione lyase